MNWIDAAIVIIFLYFMITAFSAGFVREIIGIASAVLGIVLAGLFYSDIGSTVFTSIDSVTTQNVVGFMVILVGVSLAGQIIGMLTKPAIAVLQLGIFDQLAGAALGLVKAFVLIEVVLILFVTYPRYHLDQRIKDSQFAPRMLDAAPPLLKILPDVFHSKVNQFTGT
ncbi:MAG: CvpA family protein [Chloroflexota bacterium]|nr:CvpA family protein [Chloroflexota bacterium]